MLDYFRSPISYDSFMVRGMDNMGIEQRTNTR